METILAAWKFALSYFKRTWELSDYPVRIRQFSAEPETRGRSGPAFTWSAQIVHWWMMGGHGYSRAEALEKLGANFAQRKAQATPLPRPGTSVPLSFASDDRIRRHEALAVDFFDRILGLRYDECFVSDESSLWDFHGEESNAHLHRRVVVTYGVDLSDLETAVIADILERIAGAGHALPNRSLQPGSIAADGLDSKQS